MLVYLMDWGARAGGPLASLGRSILSFRQQVAQVERLDGLVIFQSQLHEKCTGDRVERVRLDLVEPQRAIQSDRLLHYRERVQAHSLIADLPCLLDERQGQAATDFLSPG